MEADYSLDALMMFIKYVGEKGLVKAQSARTWQIAASKLLNDLSDEEKTDVRKIDVESETLRVANRKSSDLTPKTLKTYQQRVQLAINEFQSWRNDPTGYKPKATKRGRKSSKETVPPVNNRVEQTSRLVQPQKEIKTSGAEVVNTNSDNGMSDLNGGKLALPFPLRPDFLAQIVIPNDLKVEEARRLGAFLLTLAIDYKVSSS